MPGGRVVGGEFFLCLSPAYCERLNWLSQSQMWVSVKKSQQGAQCPPKLFLYLRKMDIQRYPQAGKTSVDVTLPF